MTLPPLTRTLADAEAFAWAVHAEQFDQAGKPYVEHLRRVAGGARVHAIKVGFGIASREVDEVVQIAWLHDAIEDTAYTANDLSREGFATDVVMAVCALSKDDRRPYAAWIDDLCRDASLPALIVKLADVEDNSDPSRLALLDDATRARLERKYHPALEMLRAAVTRGERDARTG